MPSDTEASGPAGRLPPKPTEPPVKGEAVTPSASPAPGSPKEHLKAIAHAHGVSVARLTEPLPAHRGHDGPPHVRIVATIELLDARTPEGLTLYPVSYIAKLFGISRQSIHENKAFAEALARRR